VSVFQNQTQSEIGFLRTKMEYLESIVHQVLEKGNYEISHSPNYSSFPQRNASGDYNIKYSSNNQYSEHEPTDLYYGSMNLKSNPNLNETSSPKDSLVEQNSSRPKPSDSIVRIEPSKSIILGTY